MAESTKTGTADVQAEFEALRRDVARLTESVSRLVGESAEETGDRIRERVHQTTARARQTANAAGTKITDFVEEKPTTSLLIAFGAGLLFGSLYRRS